MIKDELLDLTKQIAETLELPSVRRIYIPDPQPRKNRYTEFGVVELQDGSAGLYYAWLGETQQGMNRKFDSEKHIGTCPSELISLLRADNDADRSLGMAAVNAITQYFYRRSSYVPEPAHDSMGSLEIEKSDHVGMVGYFPSLTSTLRRQGNRVTVIEMKTHHTGRYDELVTVTDDPASLRGCSKIICTASTLLNDTIDIIFNNIDNTSLITMIGPTAGFLPDPLFGRGVCTVGGVQILNVSRAIQRLRHDQGLGNTVRKYIIHRNAYPGMNTLLTKIARAE